MIYGNKRKRRSGFNPAFLVYKVEAKSKNMMWIKSRFQNVANKICQAYSCNWGRLGLSMNNNGWDEKVKSLTGWCGRQEVAIEIRPMAQDLNQGMWMRFLQNSKQQNPFGKIMCNWLC